MKLYFFTEEKAVFGFFLKEPPFLAAFTLEPGQSTFEQRYALVDEALVDLYPEKTDEEVAVFLQNAEVENAAKLASELNGPA